MRRRGASELGMIGIGGGGSLGFPGSRAKLGSIRRIRIRNEQSPLSESDLADGLRPGCQPALRRDGLGHVRRRPGLVEQSKQRTEEQTKQKAELQHLRMQINRLRRMGEDTQDLLLKLKDKEKSYGRWKQQRPPGAYLATNHTDTNE